jgi:hypothetical protein
VGRFAGLYPEREQAKISLAKVGYFFSALRKVRNQHGSAIAQRRLV